MLQIAQPVTAQGQASEARPVRYVVALRERRFFHTADDYARSQLARSDLTTPTRLSLAMEHSRTLATWALHENGARREELWRQAQEVLDDARRRLNHAPRTTLLSFQAALNKLARAELLRQQAEVTTGSAEAFAPAQQLLREAIDQLKELLEQTSPPAAATLVAEFGESEVLSLRDQVRWQLARGRRNQALTYPQRSADRIAALTAGLEHLNKLQRELPASDALHYPVRLEIARHRRLLGELEAAQQQLAALAAEKPQGTLELQLRAEQIRWALAAEQLDAAQQLLQQGRQTAAGRTSPQLDLAILELYLTLWKQSDDQQNAERAAQWRQQAEQLAALIEQSYGAYWRRRADGQLAAIAGAGSGGSVALLARSADSLYLREQFDEAVATYRQAAEAAAQSGDAAQSLLLAKKAAAVLQQRERPVEAAAVLAEAALQLADDPAAPQVHLTAIGVLAQAARSNSALLPRYADYLEAHAARWPRCSTADRARLLLGKYRESRGEFSAAAEAYTAIDLASPFTPEAVAGAARVFRQIAEGAAPSADVAQATAYFQSVAERLSGAGGVDASRSAALITAIELQWELSPTLQLERWERQLQPLIADAQTPPPTRQRAAGLLVAIVAAQEGREAEALSQFNQLAGNETTQLLPLLERLGELASRRSVTGRRRVAELILNVSERLLAQASLDASTRGRVARARAAALADAGRRREALAELALLSEQNPRDAELQEAYAELLLAGDSQTDLQAALAKWRWIGTRSPRHSERWWRAKHRVALAHFRLGDRRQAAELVKYALASGARPNNDELRRELETLLRRAEGK